MDFKDYVPGSSTCFCFKVTLRANTAFLQYARFMKQEGEQQIIVPIDYDRAVKEANRRANDV